jgi:hypothetical protein
MIVLTYLFELLVGLLAVLATAATIWFAGAYILIGLVGLTALWVIWQTGKGIVSLCHEGAK